MDQNENQDVTPRTSDYVKLAVIGTAAVYSAYQLGKLGKDWAKEGVRSLKARKNRQIEN